MALEQRGLSDEAQEAYREYLRKKEEAEALAKELEKAEEAEQAKKGRS